MYRFAAAACVAILAPVAAEAQPTAEGGAYATVGYASVDAGPLTLGGLEGRLGYRFNRWFAAEAEASFGVKDDGRTLPPLSTRLRYELEYRAAVYAVGLIPLGPRTDVFGRVGYGTTKVETNAVTSGHSKTESWNFGLGAQHHFDDVNGVRFDYTRQERDSAAAGGHDNVWSVAYTRRF